MRANFIFISFLASAIDMLSLAGANAQNVSPKPDVVATGAMLYKALRCGFCHEVSASGINVPPSVANAGDKFQTAWIETYLKAPYRRRWESAGVRPILRMPNFLLNNEEARTLAAFISLQLDTTRIKQSSFELDSTLVAEGKQIFQEYACYGCHKIAGEGGEVGPDLSGVGSRLRPEYLAAFLRNPQAFIPGSSMKNFDLWEEEVLALVAYLISLK
jgi:cytochrome c2